MKPNIAERIAEIRRLIERSAGEYFPESVENYRKIHTNAIPWLTELIGEVERQAQVINGMERKIDELTMELQNYHWAHGELRKDKEKQAEEIEAMQKVIKEQDVLLDSANNAIEPLNAELDYERKENERLREALKNTRGALRIIPSDTVGYNGVLSVINSALRRDTPCD